MSTATETLHRQSKRRSSRLSEGHAKAKLDYAIQYPDKLAIEDVLALPCPTIERRLSVGNDARERNRIYAGENLGVLRAMHEDSTISGNVELVYIDPPFATGASLESRDAVHAYDDHFSGSEFIEFLRQRIIFIRELLSPSGSFYLHLDSRFIFPMKVILDEIFGISNFRNCIVRRKSNSKNFTRKQFGNIADYILFYSKTSNYTWNRQFEPWTDERPPKEYRYKEPGTGRLYMKVPVHAPGARNGETGKPWRGVEPPTGKHWQFSPSVLDELDARGEIYWSPSGNPRRKVYLDESPGIPVQDIWMDYKDAHNQNVAVTGYPTEKNLDLLKRIVAASSNQGDIVMDCFMGSGTTLVAAEELGRSWIGVDSGSKSLDTTIKRFANGSEPMGDFVNGKKRAEQSLLSFGLLQSNLDVYVSEGCLPSPPTSRMLTSWSKLFE